MLPVELAYKHPMPRRFQYSLRALLVAMTAIGIWLGLQVNRVIRQREAIAKIAKLTDGNALCLYRYEWDEDRDCRKNPYAPVEPGPAWLRNLLGIDFLDPIVAIDVQGCELTDSDLVWLLDRLPSISYLELRWTLVGNAGVSKLAALPNLKTLRVAHTKIDDLGLRDIGKIKSLRTLDLCGTGVTDDGLRSLSGLTELRTLYVDSTKITDDGINELKKSLPHIRKGRY